MTGRTKRLIGVLMLALPAGELAAIQANGLRGLLGFLLEVAWVGASVAFILSRD